MRAGSIPSLPSYLRGPNSGLAQWLDAVKPLTFVESTITNGSAFDNAAWTKNASSVVADATTGPFGTVTADSLVEDNTAAEHYVYQAAGSNVTARQLTMSVYAKAGTRSWIALGDIVGNPMAWFNLTTGVMGSVAGTVVARSMTSVGSGWYHCSMTAILPNGGPIIHICSADATGSYAGDGVSNVFIEGASVSQPKVSSWTDQSGVGNHALQATSANRPLVIQQSRNGLPGLSLDGVNDNLTSVYARAEPHTVVCTANITSAVGGLWDGITVNRDRHYKANATTMSDGDGTGGLSFGGTLQDNTHSHLVVFNGASSTYRQEIGIINTGNSGPPAAPDGVTLGSLGGNTDFIAGVIYEFMVWLRVLSEPEIAQVIRYQRSKWAL